MVRERISKQCDHLSRRYQKVADFILRDYPTVAFMTAELRRAIEKLS